jgi:antirestriction protein ArdC
VRPAGHHAGTDRDVHGLEGKGRYVRKGERAITLCRPVTVKRTTTADDGSEESTAATWFVYKAYWFVLAQTAGADLPPTPIPSWDQAKALQTLDVTDIPFESLDGNVMGFARGRSIAVSPLNPLPHKTTFHELAHVLLGHTAEGDQNDGELTLRNLRECEAEAVAMLCCAALDLPGVEFSRGYIQSWWGAGNPIPERSAQRILKAADQILKAGTVVTSIDPDGVR